MQSRRPGFTIVELLIAIVVIAILAAITIVAYSGVQRSALESKLQQEAAQVSDQLAFSKVRTGSFPSEASGLNVSDDITVDYNGSADAYCATLSVQSGGQTLSIMYPMSLQRYL